jgi:hypothetical protein
VHKAKVKKAQTTQKRNQRLKIKEQNDRAKFKNYKITDTYGIN